MGVFKGWDNFFDKVRFLLTILDQGSFLGLYMFLNNRDVNRDWYMIGSKSPVGMNIIIVKFLRVRMQENEI